MFDLRRLRKFPHQRMFPSAGTDDEKLHFVFRVREFSDVVLGGSIGSW